MSHPEQLAFFRTCVERNEQAISGARILEIGSYDVNGSVRNLFPSAEQYVGVDLVEGPGVDVVSFGHELTFDEASFDIVMSGECFEHDSHWRDTFTRMVQLARPGGLVITTCASRGRVEHGTSRSGATQSPGTEHLGSTYYENVGRESLERLPALGQFDQYRIWYLPNSADLYFAGIKAGATSGFRLPATQEIDRIESLMPLWQKLLRYPLRLAASLPISESTFQNLAVPYWRAVRRLTDLAARAKGHLAAASAG